MKVDNNVFSSFFLLIFCHLNHMRFFRFRQLCRIRRSLDSDSFAQSFPNILRSTQMDPRMALEQRRLLLLPSLSIPDNASIFTAGIHALDVALGIIRRTTSKDYVVYLDSLSSLQRCKVYSCKVENQLILKMLKGHSQLVN